MHERRPSQFAELTFLIALRGGETFVLFYGIVVGLWKKEKLHVCPLVLASLI